MASTETRSKMEVAARKVADELRKESDRGCVILAFAWMDDALTNNLQRYLLPPTNSASKSDELLGVGRPLGDASVKIDLAYRLGLLQPHTRQSLHLFRRLRNDFAHLSTELSFETPSVRERVIAIFENEEPVLQSIWSAIEAESGDSHVERPRPGKNSMRALSEAIGVKNLFGMSAGF